MLTAGCVLPEETLIALPLEFVAIVTEIPGVVLSAFPRVLLIVRPSPRPFCVTAIAAALVDVAFDGLLLTAIAEPSVDWLTAMPVVFAVAPVLAALTITPVPDVALCMKTAVTAEFVVEALIAVPVKLEAFKALPVLL